MFVSDRILFIELWQAESTRIVELLELLEGSRGRHVGADEPLEQRLGQHEDALEYLRRVVEIQPSNEEAHMALASSAIAAGDLKTASAASAS